ncbi:MAG TPA: tRNA (guanosine(46)-N7)-methyltransferase TrmB [Patescibacteria group bacterium]|nr:tRNA (guanosine(46)-N7)-methyltransferase TrmB [Patescibacteria group bacterium]
MRNDDRLKFYGRRKGKTLKQNRQSAYDEVMAWSRLELPPEIPSPAPMRERARERDESGGSASSPSADREPAGKPLSPRPLPEDGRGGFIDPRSLFDFPVRDVWMEIGFGNGEQLIHQALQHPDIGFIGCEPFMNGVAALCRDMRDNKLRNIRIFQDDARLLLPLLPDHSIGRLFLLNSDPWPKKRHHKRRVVQTETLDQFHRLLVAGGELRMSSDDPSLNEWQLEKAYFHGGFEWTAQRADDWRTRPADMLGTRYQAKGLVQGRETMFLNFRNRA